MSREDRILLSEKHGVNPSILLCPTCGKEGGIALLGRLRNDVKAPRNTADIKPCKECMEVMGQGVILVEAEESQSRITLTGNRWVISKEAALRVFKEDTPKNKAYYITKDLAEKMGLHQNDRL